MQSRDLKKRVLLPYPRLSDFLTAPSASKNLGNRMPNHDISVFCSLRGIFLLGYRCRFSLHPNAADVSIIRDFLIWPGICPSKTVENGRTI